MKKRIINLFMASVLLFSGCVGDPQQDPIVTTGAASLEKYRKNVIAAAEVVTYDTKPLIEYDPDREVYISLANQDCDFYPGYWFTKGNVLILTKEHYDTDEIQVKVPMQTEYTVKVNDWTDKCAVGSSSSFGLQLEQYMCLQGVDWLEIGQMQAYAEAAQQLLFKAAKDQEALKAYQTLREEYLEAVQTIFKKYEAEYRALTKEDVPTFGAYYVEILFPERGEFEETVETVEFIIGGKSYSVDIGQWRFPKTCPQELKNSVNRVGLKQIDIVRSGLSTSAYFGSNTYIHNTFTFEAEENLTVTGIHYEGPALDILGAQVRISGQAAFFWNMDTPIEVEKGDKVEMDLYLRDVRFREPCVCITAYPVMDYEIRGKSYGMVMPCLLIRGWTEYWETYLMAFEGIDMGAYYTFYGEDTSWLEELPEAWLE